MAKKTFPVLGTIVTVTVDRPLGSVHPEHHDMIYPVNYGYIEGITAPDGEEQDAYILGVDTPVEKFTGMVVGVICREDDVEEKWVVVPENMAGTEICWECNIMKAVEFTEKYFKSKLYPRYEKTSGAVLYTDKDNERRYLLVKTKSGHIGFPKGHVEYGETEKESALREIMEETGISAELVDGFRMEYTFTTLENTEKTGAFYLAFYEYKKSELQESEIDEEYLLPYEQALERLNWQQDKEILKGAESFLNS
ncbi:MAG: NUDIX domain-containing protein [Ruminiclostridium sp.]|nr:NUDIX domain-containing protein [Ruminiclostridium sp.]